MTVLTPGPGPHIIAAFTDHVPLSTICTTYGVSASEVARLLDQAGLEPCAVEKYLVTWTPLTTLLEARSPIPGQDADGHSSFTQALIAMAAKGPLTADSASSVRTEPGIEADRTTKSRR